MLSFWQCYWVAIFPLVYARALSVNRSSVQLLLKYMRSRWMSTATGTLSNFLWMQSCTDSIPGCWFQGSGVTLLCFNQKVYFQIYVALHHLWLNLFAVLGDEPSSWSFIYIQKIIFLSDKHWVLTQREHKKSWRSILS